MLIKVVQVVFAVVCCFIYILYIISLIIHEEKTKEIVAMRLYM